jgi:hypothetical protein
MACNLFILLQKKLQSHKLIFRVNIRNDKLMCKKMRVIKCIFGNLKASDPTKYMIWD